MATLGFRSMLATRISEQFCCMCGTLTLMRFIQRTTRPKTQVRNKIVEDTANSNLAGPEIGEVPASKEERNKRLASARPSVYDWVHIKQTDVADSISKTVVNNSNVENSLFFEINPGPGILTNALIRAGITKMRLLESDPAFLPGLETIRAKNPDNLELVHVDFFKLAKMSYVDKITSSDHISLLLQGVQIRHWTETPPLVVFAAVPQKLEATFMRYIFVSLAKLSDLFSRGRVQLMFFVSGNEYKAMTPISTSKAMYKMAYILYNSFFDIEFLAIESKTSFHQNKISKLKKSVYRFDDEHLYLIRLTPKIDLFSTFKSPDLLVEFYCFVKQHSVRRSAYVISSLERWIPDCGPRFIKEDFTIHTRFGDLLPSQYVKVFQIFSSCPEYADSQFRALLMKLDLRDNEESREDVKKAE